MGRRWYRISWIDLIVLVLHAAVTSTTREDDADIGDVYSVDLGDHEYVRG